MSNCTQPSTEKYINDTNSCICYPQYYGTLCENVHTWWFNAQYIVHSVQAVLLMLILILTSFVVREKVKRGKMMSLAGVSLVINMLSISLRVIWCVLPSIELVPFAPNYGVLYYIAGVLIPTPVALWFIATGLVIVYWYDGLQNSLNNNKPGVTSATKYVIIGIGAVLVALAVVGMFLSTSGMALGHLIYYVPLCIFTIGLIAVTILIGVLSNKADITQKMLFRNRWNIRLFTCLCFIWCIFCIALGLYKYMPLSLMMFITIVIRIIEVLTSVVLLSVVDYKFKVIRSLVVCGKQKEEKASLSTTSTRSVMGAPS